MDAEIASIAATFVNYLEEQGIPLVDHAAGLDLEKPKDRLDQAKQAMSELPVELLISLSIHQKKHLSFWPLHLIGKAEWQIIRLLWMKSYDSISRILVFTSSVIKRLNLYCSTK